MELIEYNEKMKAIEADYDAAKQSLYREYGLSQAIYKIGDIIKDSTWIILIDKITVSLSMDSIPYPVYRGLEYTKSLAPKKNMNRAAIFGNKNTELLKSA